MDTLIHYRSGGSKGNRLFVRMAVEGRASNAAIYQDRMVDAIRAGMDAGVDRATLQDQCGWTVDTLSSLKRDLERDLDNEGISIDLLRLDLSPINELHAELAAR
jgi:hypothetical protein